MALPEVINAALERMQYIAKTETVFGEPVTIGNVTLIPVSRVSIGFAAGGAGVGEKSGSGAGTGGGVNVTPAALITISDGDVKVHSLESWDSDLGKLLSMAPEAMEKLTKLFKKKKNEEEDKNGNESTKTDTDT
ncbi:MAG: hypothetical protein LBC70_07630 [Chitinispirillales bacterium]|jgi:uncharacterized spore protein YtfJ|nr:hypothetical protein [Chitinispirillales bacterium]